MVQAPGEDWKQDWKTGLEKTGKQDWKTAAGMHSNKYIGIREHIGIRDYITGHTALSLSALGTGSPGNSRERDTETAHFLLYGRQSL